MDTRGAVRDTEGVARPGAAREQLAEALNAAYGAGLLSENTLFYRLDVLLSSRLIDPVRLVGDLTRRVPRRGPAADVRQAITTALGRLRTAVLRPEAEGSVLLALDWTGGPELLVGRHSRCDVRLPHPSVSRRHARLSFRDGSWVLRDLESKNGTWVNGVRVGRCALQPGDLVHVGGHDLTIG